MSTFRMIAPVLLVIALCASPPAAMAQPRTAAAPTDVLQKARTHYVESRFQEAADLLAETLREGRIAGDDLNAARALRARCLAKLGRRIESRELFKGVLRSDPSFRLDPLQVPPDEMEVFDRALRDFQAEQVEAGKRYPSSIGGSLGRGQGVHQDFADLASSAGVAEADDFEGELEIGLSVRFPIKPRWSLEFEIASLRSTTADQLPVSRNAHATYTVAATPVVATVLYHMGENPKLRYSLLAGLGFMPSDATLEFERSLVSGRIIPTQLLGDAVGFYGHVGVEADLFLTPRFAISGRMLARRAHSGPLEFPRDDFEVYESYPQSVLGERSADFSGLAAHIGVRAYIGY